MLICSQQPLIITRMQGLSVGWPTCPWSLPGSKFQIRYPLKNSTRCLSLFRGSGSHAQSYILEWKGCPFHIIKRTLRTKEKCKKIKKMRVKTWNGRPSTKGVDQMLIEELYWFNKTVELKIVVL